MPESLKRSQERSLVRIALLSRLFAFLLAVCSRAFLSDFDESAQIYLNGRVNNTNNHSFLDLISVFCRWDSLYFMHIAEHGYVYEQEHAFFPGLPLLMRSIQYFLGKLLLINVSNLTLCRLALAKRRQINVSAVWNFDFTRIVCLGFDTFIQINSLAD